MPKLSNPNIDVLEKYEELQTLLEVVKLPLTKCVKKGTKQAGVNARRALREAQRMLKDIIDGSLAKQKEINATKAPHGNTNGPGIKAMQEARKKLMENKKDSEDNS